jgi:anaerobic magnesium-protoporphyrin IX monomethyl ester cyclase
VRLVDALFLGSDRHRRYDSGFLIGLTDDEIVRRIPRDTELIGVGAPFSQLAPVVHGLVAGIKDAFPHTPIVMGGAYPSTQPGLALTSQADMIVVGEGERPLLALADGAIPADLAGVYTRSRPGDGEYISAEVVQDLDDLPFPDCTVTLVERYFAVSSRGWAGPAASIATSRGCPYDCEFCSIHPIHGWRYRARCPGLVLEEIEHLARRFRVRLIEFEDDNLTLDRERAAAIFEGLIRLREKGLPLEWRTPNGVRIDTLDDELIGVMKRSGCRELTLGLEHGDPEILALMGKHLDLEHAFRVLELCRKHEIPKVVLFYIVGYPGETPASFATGLKYLERVRQLGGDIRVSSNFAQPYPGTRLLKRCRAEGYVDSPNYDNFLVRQDITSSDSTVSVKGQGLNRREIQRRRDAVYRVFGSSQQAATQSTLYHRLLRAAARRLRET